MKPALDFDDFCDNTSLAEILSQAEIEEILSEIPELCRQDLCELKQTAIRFGIMVRKAREREFGKILKQAEEDMVLQ